MKSWYCDNIVAANYFRKNIPLHVFDRVLNMSWFWIYLGSQNASGSEHTRVLSILGAKYAKVTQGPEYAWIWCPNNSWICLNMAEEFLNMPDYPWICLNMPEYAGICVDIPKYAWMARNHKLFSWKDEIWFFL